MKLNLQLIWRLPLCIASATVYAVITNAYALAVLLALSGHWRLGVAVVLLWLALCLLAVATGVHRKSRLAGLEEVDIFTAHHRLSLLGDEQQGWSPQWLVDRWPRWAPVWLVAFSCCAWRNRLRNLPFVPWLAWLHKPDPDALPIFDVWTIRGVRFELHWRGWLTELKASKGRWFLDIGPRLDQPDAWGGVSWAYRLWGRL